MGALPICQNSHDKVSVRLAGSVGKNALNFSARYKRMEPDSNTRVAGLVLLRQRPGTAKGVIFVTLEDETGTCNVVVWANVYERFRRAVIAGRMLRVTGRLQRDAGVVHVVAEVIEDLSPMLDQLLRPDFRHDGVRAGDQP